MIPGFNRVRQEMLQRRRARRARLGMAATNGKGTKLVWWRRGATALAVGYLVASQALADLPGWSSVAFGLAVLLAALLAAGHFLRIQKVHVRRLVFLPLAFLAYCLLRSFSGIKDTSPFDVLLQLTSAFLGAIGVAAALQSGVRFRWLIYAQVASSLLQMALFFTGSGLEPAPVAGEDLARYSGLTDNANELALQCTLGACLIWLLPRKSGVVPCCFAFGSVAFALAVTGSRKAVLVAAFFLVMVIIQAFELVPKERRRWLVAAVVGVPCLLGLLLAPMALERGRDLLVVERSLAYEDSSYRTRAEMIEQGIQLWCAAPVFGNGMDAFRGLSGQGTYSHNNYVELLCNLGVVGALLFYALYGQVALQAAHARRFVRWYCWVFVLMLLAADVGYVSYKSKLHLMILMVLLVVTRSRYAVSPRRSAARHQARHVRNVPRRPRRFLLGT